MKNTSLIIHVLLLILFIVILLMSLPENL
jgi:hypothetical protein